MEFSDLQVGDEVATTSSSRFGGDRAHTIYKIVRRNDKAAWAKHNDDDVFMFRLRDGQIIGRNRSKVRRVDDEIRRQVASAQKREVCRDLVFELDRLDVLRQDLKPDFVDRLYAALSPFKAEVEQLVELSKKRRY